MALALWVVAVLLMCGGGASPPHISSDFSANLTERQVSPSAFLSYQQYAWSVSQNRVFFHGSGPSFPAGGIFRLSRYDEQWVATWTGSNSTCHNCSLSRPFQVPPFFSIPTGAQQRGPNVWAWKDSFGGTISLEVNLTSTFPRPIQRNITNAGTILVSDVTFFSRNIDSSLWNVPGGIMCHAGCLGDEMIPSSQSF